MAERPTTILAGEFPVPCGAFTASLEGTPDEVYSRLMMNKYGREKHTPDEWKRLLKDLSQEKVFA